MSRALLKPMPQYLMNDMRNGNCALSAIAQLPFRTRARWFSSHPPPQFDSRVSTVSSDHLSRREMSIPSSSFGKIKLVLVLMAPYVEHRSLTQPPQSL